MDNSFFGLVVCFMSSVTYSSLLKLLALGLIFFTFGKSLVFYFFSHPNQTPSRGLGPYFGSVRSLLARPCVFYGALALRFTKYMTHISRDLCQYPLWLGKACSFLKLFGPLCPFFFTFHFLLVALERHSAPRGQGYVCVMFIGLLGTGFQCPRLQLFLEFFLYYPLLRRYLASSSGFVQGDRMYYLQSFRLSEALDLRLWCTKLFAALDLEGVDGLSGEKIVWLVRLCTRNLIWTCGFDARHYLCSLYGSSSFNFYEFMWAATALRRLVSSIRGVFRAATVLCPKPNTFIIPLLLFVSVSLYHNMVCLWSVGWASDLSRDFVILNSTFFIRTNQYSASDCWQFFIFCLTKWLMGLFNFWGGNSSVVHRVSPAFTTAKDLFLYWTTGPPRMACKINFAQDSRYGRFLVVFWPFTDTHSTSFRGLGLSLYYQLASFLLAYVVMFFPCTLGNTLVVTNHASTGLTFVPLWLWVYHWWRRLMVQSLLHASWLLGIFILHPWISLFVIRYCVATQSLGSHKYFQMATFIMLVLAPRLASAVSADADICTDCVFGLGNFVKVAMRICGVYNLSVFEDITSTWLIKFPQLWEITCWAFGRTVRSRGRKVIALLFTSDSITTLYLLRLRTGVSWKVPWNCACSFEGIYVACMLLYELGRQLTKEIQSWIPIPIPVWPASFRSNLLYNRVSIYWYPGLSVLGEINLGLVPRHGSFSNSLCFPTRILL